MTLESFHEFITHLNDELKSLHNGFTYSFRVKRKEILSLGTTGGNHKFFNLPKGRDYVFHVGGRSEAQIHIFYRNNKIGYGLGFSLLGGRPVHNQPANVYASRIIDSFLSLPTVESELKRSGFVYLLNDKQTLIQKVEGEYVLIGKTIYVTPSDDGFKISDSDYRELITSISGILTESYFQIMQTFRQPTKQLLSSMRVNTIIELLKSKDQIILQGPPGTGKTRLAIEIAIKLVDPELEIEYDEKGKLIKPEGFDEQVKIVQFHPSYTYEDFVRGISVNTENSESPVYQTENRHLGKLAKTALASQKTGGMDDFHRAWTELIEDIDSGKIKKVGTSNVNVEINTQGSIKFGSPVATYETTYQLYKFGETDLKYETYQKITLKFLKKKYNLKKYVESTHVDTDKIKNYVLIIDEINRANLSSVLGELIYALEYRGESVESIYSTFDEKNKIIIPDNLYIIGTMNTADRSVGHIDYAIRRRFAFKSILPEDISGSLEKKYDFAREEFEDVKKLFTKDGTNWERSDFLSGDFDPKDVCIGHSYFIYSKGDEQEKQLRLNYEVMPILQEYARDGVFNEKGREAVEKLWVDA